MNESLVMGLALRVPALVVSLGSGKSVYRCAVGDCPVHGSDAVTAGSRCDGRMHCEPCELLFCVAVAVPNGAMGSAALPNPTLVGARGFPRMHPSVQPGSYLFTAALVPWCPVLHLSWPCPFGLVRAHRGCSWVRWPQGRRVRGVPGSGVGCELCRN